MTAYCYANSPVETRGSQRSDAFFLTGCRRRVSGLVIPPPPSYRDSTAYTILPPAVAIKKSLSSSFRDQIAYLRLCNQKIQLENDVVFSNYGREEWISFLRGKKMKHRPTGVKETLKKCYSMALPDIYYEDEMGYFDLTRPTTSTASHGTDVRHPIQRPPHISTIVAPGEIHSNEDPRYQPIQVLSPHKGPSQSVTPSIVYSRRDQNIPDSDSISSPIRSILRNPIPTTISIGTPPYFSSSPSDRMRMTVSNASISRLKRLNLSPSNPGSPLTFNLISDLEAGSPPSIQMSEIPPARATHELSSPLTISSR